MNKKRTTKRCAHPNKIKAQTGWAKGRPLPNLPLGMEKAALIGDTNELARMIIQYAGAKGMTMSNIRESVRKVERHMKNNAVLDFHGYDHDTSPVKIREKYDIGKIAELLSQKIQGLVRE